MKIVQRLASAALALALAVEPAAADPVVPAALFNVPVEFLLFAATLAGVAFFHQSALPIALSGLAVITAWKLLVTGFPEGSGLAGLGHHLAGEWIVLTNLFLLLTGFALLARTFDQTRVPEIIPDILPDDWTGGAALLGLVFVLSSVLDNIAAALIGATIARSVFRERVHVGYLAGIVAASNAGGSGSVLGDTTTTMMWIHGVSPLSVLEAYVAAVVALMIFAIPASLQQHRLQPIQKDATPGVRVDWPALGIAVGVLAAAVIANAGANLWLPEVLDRAPVIGLAVLAATLLGALVRRPDWSIMPATLKGTVFLLALVTAASMMPVERLPAPSWQSVLGLGFVSAVFDNIPLTALALKQGGYDWGYVAYAVGFGGSMIWFGSSAGVAVASMCPQARSVGAWLRAGWHVAVAYVVGFAVMLLLLGWHPDAPHRNGPEPSLQQTSP